MSIDREHLIALHKDLVRINSVGPGLEGCERAERPMIEYLHNYFLQFGLPVALQEVEDGRANVLATLQGSEPKTLILESHMDVVSTAGMTIAPFDPLEREGRIYGRGSCDTKGSMACMLAAMQAFVKANVTPPATIVFVGMVGEEVRFEGARRFVEWAEPRADGAIIGEPTLCRAVTAHKGGLRYNVHTFGKAAHGSTPRDGSNAIYQMRRVLQMYEEDLIPRFARQSHPLCGHSTINIGLINGGTQVNFVPDACSIRVDQRLIPGEDLHLTLAVLFEALEHLEKNHPGLKAELGGIFSYPPMESTAQSEIVRCCFAATGQDAPLGAPYGTDASFIQQLGIPCVVLGPGSIRQAHQPDEYIEIEQLFQCAEIYRQVIAEFGIGSN